MKRKLIKFTHILFIFIIVYVINNACDINILKYISVHVNFIIMRVGL